jgi:hypothetical protein
MFADAKYKMGDVDLRGGTWVPLPQGSKLASRYPGIFEFNLGEKANRRN